MYKYVTTARMYRVESLLKRNIPNQTLREEALEKIRATRSTNRAEKIRRTHHRKLWRALLRDLVYEKNNVRMGMRYQPVQNLEQRQEVFDAYLKTIEKVETLIRDHAESGITPSEYAKQKGLPNNGIHWTDWVPARIRAAIAAAFDALPHTPRAKRKLPFQRTRRPDKGKADVKRLRARTEKELALEEQELMLDPTNEVRRRRVAQMRTALNLMDNLKPSDAVPATWHGMFIVADEE